jgi:Flp pilus assembly protein TadB
MTPQALLRSEQAYRILLRAYPPRFRRRFEHELAQLFRTSCRVIYAVSGNGGLRRLWLSTLWDWALSATREQVLNLLRRSEMNDTTTFDRQLGDIVWMIMNGLRAAYSLEQVFEALSKELPEPAASAFKQLHVDLNAGLTLDEAFANLKRAVPSKHLAEVVAVIQQHGQDWETANLLAPLSEKIIAQAGSDPALYAAMHRQAEALGASVPERAK